MNIEQARSVGAVQDFTLVSVAPLVDNGVAVIPYGVTTIQRDSLKSDWACRAEVVLLPETVIRFEEMIKYPWGSCTVKTYEGKIPPKAINCDRGTQDLRYVEQYVLFPPFSEETWSCDVRPENRHIVVHPEFSYEGIMGGMAKLEFAGESSKYTLIDGALYDSGCETLLYYPRSSNKPVSPKLPASVKTIETQAFWKANISKLKLNSNVKKLMPRAFSYAYADEIILSDEIDLVSQNVETLYELFGSVHVEHIQLCGPFESFCGEKVVLPEGIKEISSGAFRDAWRLKELRIPETVERIGEDAFKSCRALSLVVPDAVREISRSSYDGVCSIGLPAHFYAEWATHVLEQGTTVVGIRNDNDGYRIACFLPEDGMPEYARRQIPDGSPWVALDRYFADDIIKGFSDKVRVALTRLCSMDMPEARASDEMIELYRSYLKRNAKRAFREFEESKDFVCISMLESLGYSSSKIRATVRKESAKPKKPSAAELCNDAIEALRKGDTSGIAALKPHATRLRPTAPTELLMFAAAKGDDQTIEQLYAMFGEFEMPSLALSRAIAFGNESTARALIDHGVKLEPAFKPVAVKGDTPQKQKNRRQRYLDVILTENGFDIPGRTGLQKYHDGYLYFMTLSKKSDDLLIRLANEGAFSKTQLKMLTIAALADTDESFRSGKPKVKLARALYQVGGNNDAQVKVTVQDGTYHSHWHEIADYKDLLFVGCSVDTAKGVCSVMPERINSMWEAGMARYPDIAKTMIAHLDPARFANSSAVLNAFAKVGYTKEIKQMARRGFPLTENALFRAAIIASNAGHMETMATILSLKNADSVESSASNLAL